MYCNKCGGQISEESFFCSYCGEKTTIASKNKTETTTDNQEIVQDKIVKNNKTLHNLYSKGVNRFLKVLYITCYSLVILITLLIGISVEATDATVLALVIEVIIFELIRRSFYFIATGTINPKK